MKDEGRKTEERRPKTEDGKQKTNDRKTKDRRQKTEDRERRTKDKGQRDRWQRLEKRYQKTDERNFSHRTVVSLTFVVNQFTLTPEYTI